MSHTVLLVDDDERLLEGLQRQLHKEPYRLLTARSGQEALDILHGTCVDVVVSDQEMPGLKGTQFLWQVRKAFPGAILFMLTGHPSLPITALAIKEVGIARVFAKPCNASDMAMTIRQALQHKDLMTLAKRLLRKVTQQGAVLKRLELESPGITRVGTDGPGAVVQDEDDLAGCDALIEKIRSALGQQEEASWL